jgi:hypothetical protein
MTIDIAQDHYRPHHFRVRKGLYAMGKAMEALKINPGSWYAL